MSKKHLIWCGPETPPSQFTSQYDRKLRLNTFPRQPNVFLKLENISTKLAQNIPSIAMDMLEVGSYVYCADQSVSRGGATWRGDGRDWIRNLTFDIPVRHPEIWNSNHVKEDLTETLGYLSDDNYEFNFREVQQEIPLELYFDFHEEKPWFDAEGVLLFSGGLDSMAGAIEEIINRQRKVVLVSHRPVAKISKRQTDLLQELCNLRNIQGKFLHVPVWVNKDQGLTRDVNQRTRSFLYTMLAASVAVMHKLDSIDFYENGIVSTNLPLSGQVVGGRASRSTHPKVLHGLSKLLGHVLNEDFKVQNPFFWKTKSDVIRVFKDSELTELIKLSSSCSSVRASDTLNTHCGVCSQCIERRLATLFNEVRDDDPAEIYKINLFLDPIEKPRDRTMVESYIRHMRILESISVDEFFQRFGEANRVLGYLGIPCSEAAEKLFELHRRQGEQACTVIEDQVSCNANRIARGQIHSKSLLAMILGQLRKKLGSRLPPMTFPTPDGTQWEDIEIEIIADDLARIMVKGKTYRYTGVDMGFRDGRRTDFLNKQWDLLLVFAQGKGVLSWESLGAKARMYKKVYLLKKTLQAFFRINDSPIATYKRGIGYVTRFSVKDLRYGAG